VAVALNPIPVADLLAALAVDVGMVVHLSRLYGLPLSRQEAGSLVKVIATQLTLLMGTVWAVNLISSALKLGIEPPVGRTPEGNADLDNQVPMLARVWVKSSAAEIEVTAGGGSVEVAGGSGRVRIAGRAASVSVETLDGNVELALEHPVLGPDFRKYLRSLEL
jgi:hypothetical protein